MIEEEGSASQECGMRSFFLTVVCVRMSVSDHRSMAKDRVKN